MGVNKTWWVVLLPEFWREGGSAQVAGDLFGPVHLSPHTCIHLVAANRLLAELLEEMISFRNWPTNWVCTNGKCIRITRQSFKSRVSGATSTVILIHVSLPGTAWCPNSKEWSTNTTDSEPSRVFIKHGDPWAPAQTYGVRILGRGPLESHRVQKSSGWLWEVNLRLQDVKYWPFQF